MNATAAHQPPGFSATGLTTVVAAHALVFALLLHWQVVRLPLPPQVLSISLLSASAPPPPPAISPPKPRPVAPRPIPAAPLPPTPTLAVAADAPTAVVAAVTPQPPAPTAVPTPASTPAPPREAPAAPTPPRFDADYLDNPRPAYPAISRRLGEEGRVVLRVVVGADGLPQDVQPHSSSGHERLDAAALAVVRRWKFIPARRGSEPIAAAVLVPIAFSLRD